MDPSTAKYQVKATLQADGVVEKADIIGAIFGQTEGLLGEELDLRELQKSGRIGRIEVEVSRSRGKSLGKLVVPSGLDQIETAILASALETIDRVGPCRARITIDSISDVRLAKRDRIIRRAKELYSKMSEQSKNVSSDITASVRQSVQVDEITLHGKDKLPAGPNVGSSDAIIIVEGRSDVLNLLKYGIRNAIAVEGTNIPETIIKMAQEKIVTLFVDGDRGGELIMKEILQMAEVDFVARAPPNLEVEELTEKQIMKCLKNKIPVEQFLSMYGSSLGIQPQERKGAQPEPAAPEPKATSAKRKGRGPPQVAERPANAERLVAILSSVSGQAKTVFTDAEYNQIDESPIAEMIDRLMKGEGIHAVVFDGVVSQRLLDVAHERGVRMVVADRVGNVGKFPNDVTIVLKKDLGMK